MSRWTRDAGVAPEEMVQPADLAEALRFLLRTSPTCLVREIEFTPPAQREIIERLVAFRSRGGRRLLAPSDLRGRLSRRSRSSSSFHAPDRRAHVGRAGQVADDDAGGGEAVARRLGVVVLEGDEGGLGARRDGPAGLGEALGELGGQRARARVDRVPARPPPARRARRRARGEPRRTSAGVS